jgi:hypothetical protein
LGGVDAAGSAGEVADEFCVFTVFVQDEDVDFVGGVFNFFVFRRNTFILQELKPRHKPRGYRN